MQWDWHHRPARWRQVLPPHYSGLGRWTCSRAQSESRIPTRWLTLASARLPNNKQANRPSGLYRVKTNRGIGANSQDSSDFLLGYGDIGFSYWGAGSISVCNVVNVGGEVRECVAQDLSHTAADGEMVHGLIEIETLPEAWIGMSVTLEIRHDPAGSDHFDVDNISYPESPGLCRPILLLSPAVLMRVVSPPCATPHTERPAAAHAGHPMGARSGLCGDVKWPRRLG